MGLGGGMAGHKVESHVFLAYSNSAEYLGFLHVAGPVRISFLFGALIVLVLFVRVLLLSPGWP